MPNWFSAKPEEDFDNRDFEWCIIGNIIDQHYWGADKIIRRGSKHFRPGAKVYCLPEFAGMAHEDMRVIGQPRKQRRLINVILKTKLIKNFRVQKVFQPKLQYDIGSHFYYWTNRRSKDEVQNLQRMVEYLSSLTEEIDDENIKA